ncbi:MAG: carbohydrate binding family 9 domain-containing protein [Candidatus Zixiibacteriota bacterium]
MRHAGYGTIIIISFLILASIAAADETFKPVFHPQLNVPKLAGNIKIDGNLDDSGWKNAGHADNFVEYRPGDKTKPPVNTEAFITYDNDQLYVAFLCEDDPATIRASYCDRDKAYSDDNVCLLIDTYGDAVWAYEIFCNPHGIQGDIIWSSTGGEDGSYDLIWQSAGKITDSGYQVEMAIPFASLRFPNQPSQKWILNFWRNHPRESRRQYTWAAFDRDINCWPCQWGTVTGIENVQPGRGLEILPSVIGYQTGERDDDIVNFNNDDPDGEMSLGAIYRPVSNVTIEGTYNPDFSQVESDETQIDINTTYALEYPEKRPFFQEGSDMFHTWFDVVYTRSINDPDAAAKLTARFNRTNVTYMAAHDENSLIILPFEEASSIAIVGKNWSNILRVKQALGDKSYAGILVTDRRYDGGGSGTVLSTDIDFNFAENYYLQGQFLASHTAEPNDPGLTPFLSDDIFYDGHTAVYDGEKYWGHGYLLCGGRSAKNMMVDITYVEVSPTFRTDNGIESKNNSRSFYIWTGYRMYPNKRLIDEFMPSFSDDYHWNFDGTYKKRNTSVELDATLIGQTSYHPMYRWSYEKFRGVEFNDIWLVHNCMNTRFSRLLEVEGGVNIGDQIVRNRAISVLGRETTAWLSTVIRPVERLKITTSYTYMTSDSLEGGHKFFETWVGRAKLDYQFTKELSARLVTQYDEDGRSWTIDPLLTYRINAFSLFYAGSAYAYEEYHFLDNDEYQEKTKLQSRQFFMKLQYLFQL